MGIVIANHNEHHHHAKSLSSLSQVSPKSLQVSFINDS